MRKYEQPQMGVNMLKSCFAGVTISMVIMLLLTGVSAVILARGIVSEEHGRIIQLLNHTLAAFVGCLTVNKIEKGKILINTAIIGTGYALLCATVNALIFGAEYRSVYLSLTAIIGGMITACLLCGIKVDKATKRYKRLKL